MNKYSLGIDFGTESARVLLVRVRDGQIISQAVSEYPDGVIEGTLPGTGRPLQPFWALQEPRDYLSALEAGIPEALRKAGIHPDEVAGIGIDFTSCTILPVDAKGNPLCWDPVLREDPHSWVKLWKHRAASGEADRINEAARARNEAFLERYPAGVSPEWMLPKILQVLREAPAVFDAADRFLEAADWVVWQLTGSLMKNTCAAGYKATWSLRDGYPSEEYLAAVDPRLKDLASTKLRGPVRVPGTLAGGLSPEMAARLGLLPGTPVAVPIIDAHAGVLGAGITGPGKMLLVAGTSICHMFLSERRATPKGVAGVVEDGILPGLCAYEAGQAAAGDMLAWFVGSLVPETLGADLPPGQIHDVMSRLAAQVEPGSHGLVVLDWWNGSRYLGTSDVCGTILGLTLSTRPEHIYLAIVESLAFGTRLILESMVRSGVTVDDLLGCGTLVRNPLVAQVFADATGLPFTVLQNPHISALGAAILGAVAAGGAGGYESLEAACANMAKSASSVYRPVASRRRTYEDLFRAYAKAHDLLSSEGADIMTTLNRLRKGTGVGDGAK